MGKIKVGVKFCGHCNPTSDGPEIVKAAAALSGSLEFVPWEDGGKELLLIISGCPNDCASMPVFDGPVVHVANNVLNGKQWPADKVPEAIVKTIKLMLAGR
jgi:hypothetical protein